eukprot:6100977-Prymnesium_polylepis.1
MLQPAATQKDSRWVLVEGYVVGQPGPLLHLVGQPGPPRHPLDVSAPASVASRSEPGGGAATLTRSPQQDSSPRASPPRRVDVACATDPERTHTVPVRAGGLVKGAARAPAQAATPAASDGAVCTSAGEASSAAALPSPATAPADALPNGPHAGPAPMPMPMRPLSPLRTPLRWEVAEGVRFATLEPGGQRQRERE